MKKQRTYLLLKSSTNIESKIFLWNSLLKFTFTNQSTIATKT